MLTWGSRRWSRGREKGVFRAAHTWLLVLESQNVVLRHNIVHGIDGNIGSTHKSRGSNSGDFGSYLSCNNSQNVMKFFTHVLTLYILVQLERTSDIRIELQHQSQNDCKYWFSD